MKEAKIYSLAMVKPEEDVASDHTIVLVDEEELRKKINAKKEGGNCFFIEVLETNIKGWVSQNDIKIFPF